MLKTKRQAHREAIQRIFELQDTKKQNEMLTLVVKKLFEVLDGSMRKLNKIQLDSDKPETIKLDQESMNGEIDKVDDFFTWNAILYIKP